MLRKTRTMRLLVSLLHDRCLARLGLGARAVALNAAAHACRVALIWPAQFPASPQGRERLKRGLLCSKWHCPPGPTTGSGSSIGRTEDELSRRSCGDRDGPTTVDHERGKMRISFALSTMAPV